MTTGRNEFLVMAGLMTFTLTVTAQVKDRAVVMLQAGIKLELVDGDLKGAIEQFKKVAQQSSPDVAAEALSHMAACYDRLGQPGEARHT